MKIIRKDKTQKVMFDYLDVGAVFIEHLDDGEVIQIKIASETGHNAVSLQSGELYTIDDDTMVTPVNAKLIIELYPYNEEG